MQQAFQAHPGLVELRDGEVDQGRTGCRVVRVAERPVAQEHPEVVLRDPPLRRVRLLAAEGGSGEEIEKSLAGRVGFGRCVPAGQGVLAGGDDVVHPSLLRRNQLQLAVHQRAGIEKLKRWVADEQCYADRKDLLSLDLRTTRPTG